MEDLWTVLAGALLGLLLIGGLTAFPGKPFDYDKSGPSHGTGTLEDLQSVPQSPEKRTRDIEVAARQLKVHKLQELLGLEKHEVQQMINLAKADAIDGHQRHSPANYSRWFDMILYCVFGGLMVLVLRTEYSIDVIQILAGMFPREAETVGKIAAVVSSRLSWW